MKPHEVIVIGTEPPCPRCALLGELVSSHARRHGVDIRLRHISFDSAQAHAIAKSLGLTTGTAKHVAKELDLKTDWEHVYALIASPPRQALPVETDNQIEKSWTMHCGNARRGRVKQESL